MWLGCPPQYSRSLYQRYTVHERVLYFNSTFIVLSALSVEVHFPFLFFAAFLLVFYFFVSWSPVGEEKTHKIISSDIILWETTVLNNLATILKKVTIFFLSLSSFGEKNMTISFNKEISILSCSPFFLSSSVHCLPLLHNTVVTLKRKGRKPWTMSHRLKLLKAY